MIAFINGKDHGHLWFEHDLHSLAYIHSLHHTYNLTLKYQNSAFRHTGPFKENEVT